MRKREREKTGNNVTKVTFCIYFFGEIHGRIIKIKERRKCLFNHLAITRKLFSSLHRSWLLSILVTSLISGIYLEREPINNTAVILADPCLYSSPYWTVSHSPPFVSCGKESFPHRCLPCMLWTLKTRFFFIVIFLWGRKR